MSAELKLLVGSVPQGYFAYFHTRFPRMFMCCFRFVRDSFATSRPCLQLTMRGSDLAKEDPFVPYFTLH